MARSAATGELTAGADALGRSFPDGKTRFAVATPADEADLRELLRATPTPGGVSLRFEREPDYLAGENVAGSRDTTIIARRDGRVVCMGRCSRRIVYWAGRAREVGYLSELRLRAGAPRGTEILREGYAFFARYEANRPDGPADLYFTSVAKENARARRVLESGRLGLPKYRALGELATVAMPVRKTASARMAVDEVQRATASEAELGEFLDREARRYALASPWSAKSWAALRAHGLGAQDFCVIRNAGRIIAAAGLWDQSEWRQTVVADYARAWRRARQWLNAWAKLMGRPGLPEAGERLQQAMVHPLAIAEAAESAADQLLDALTRLAAARGMEWLVASVAAEDPLLPHLRKRSGARVYPTRLYTVELPGLSRARMSENAEQFIRPEAGLL